MRLVWLTTVVLFIVLGTNSVGVARSERIITTKVAQRLSMTKAVQRLLVSAGLVGVLVGGNLACDKIQPPLAGTRRTTSIVSTSYYNDSYRALSSFHSDTVTDASQERLAVPITLYDRLASFRDFRLAVDDGTLLKVFYGVIGKQDSNGEFTIYDRHGPRAVDIGSGQMRSGVVNLNIRSDNSLEAQIELYAPDVSSEHINREIVVTINDNRVPETATVVYRTTMDWRFSLTSTEINQPQVMPAYQQLASSLGRETFSEMLAGSGPIAQTVVHDSLDTNIYLNDSVTVRKRIFHNSGLDGRWVENRIAGVNFQVKHVGLSNELTVTAGSQTISGLPIGDRGYQRGLNNYVTDLAKVQTDNAGNLYRMFSMEVTAHNHQTWERIHFAGLGKGSHFIVNPQRLVWNISESLAQSGW